MKNETDETIKDWENLNRVKQKFFAETRNGNFVKYLNKIMSRVKNLR